MKNININYEKAISLEKENLKWQRDEETNTSRKIFSKEGRKETSIIKLDENSTFNNSNDINSVEIYVLSGVYSNELGDFKEGTYLKILEEDESKISSKNQCEIFRKINYPQIEKENITVNTNLSSWHQGQGNLQVMPLSFQTALVKWPKNEVFISHKHWGGEEIFVLNGEFIDEHGKYKEGTWIRSPHLSTHHPYVEEETIIFVKTGHM